MAVDVDRQLIVAQMARRGPTNDCATLRPLVDAAHQRVPIALVLADAEFDSERNHQHVRQILQAQSVIPAKRGGAAWQIHGIRAQMRQEFPVGLYRRRALIESLISAVKRKLSARAPGRSFQTQCLQALLLGIAYNIYRLWWFAWLELSKMSTKSHAFYPTKKIRGTWTRVTQLPHVIRSPVGRAGTKWGMFGIRVHVELNMNTVLCRSPKAPTPLFGLIHEPLEA